MHYYYSVKDRRMTIPDEAVEAAAAAIYEAKYEYRDWSEAKTPETWREYARAALSAATRHMLKDMRRMTLVEIASRDRPESMEAARQHIRAERALATSERLRAEREKAWEEGRLTQFDATAFGAPLNANPHCPTEMARLKRETMDADRRG